MKKPESICIFGDSTSWGAWDLEKGGWASRLWFHLAKREGDEYVELYNQSISGGTTDTILKRLESEATVRKADALIFQTGGNDASYEHTPGNYIVKPDIFRGNITEIVRQAKKITDRIVFFDLKNCDESQTMPVPWADIYYANKDMDIYSEIMQDICKKEGVLFLEMPFLENEDFDDGLHPNASGHEKVFVRVRDFLIARAWI